MLMQTINFSHIEVTKSICYRVCMHWVCFIFFNNRHEENLWQRHSTFHWKSHVYNSQIQFPKLNCRQCQFNLCQNFRIWLWQCSDKILKAKLTSFMFDFRGSGCSLPNILRTADGELLHKLEGEHVLCSEEKEVTYRIPSCRCFHIPLNWQIG